MWKRRWLAPFHNTFHFVCKNGESYSATARNQDIAPRPVVILALDEHREASFRRIASRA
jgi:hypothetical protein